jgi:hypothetical protein
MSARQQGPYDTLARKWLALAERRQAHLIELRESGRWKRYFTASELDQELREVNLACNRFARVAGLESQPAAASPADQGRAIVPLPAGESASRYESAMEAAIEAALSAAAELQESVEQSAA